MRELLPEAIYEIVRRIPCGRATSYGAIAKAIGFPDNARMVGRIMGECSSDETKIPAHRVVNSQGILSGKDAFGTPDRMRQLLEEEGVIIVNNRIKNWKTVFWNPIEEIGFEEEKNAWTCLKSRRDI